MFSTGPIGGLFRLTVVTAMAPTHGKWSWGA